MIEQQVTEFLSVGGVHQTRPLCLRHGGEGRIGRSKDGDGRTRSQRLGQLGLVQGGQQGRVFAPFLQHVDDRVGHGGRLGDGHSGVGGHLGVGRHRSGRGLCGRRRGRRVLSEGSGRGGQQGGRGGGGHQSNAKHERIPIFCNGRPQGRQSAARSLMRTETISRSRSLSSILATQTDIAGINSRSSHGHSTIGYTIVTICGHIAEALLFS